MVAGREDDSFVFQAEDGIRDRLVTGVQTCALPILDRAMHAFVETEGVPIAQIIHAVRVAVTGKAVGFGLFEGLAILGRDACVARIDRALARLSAAAKASADPP